MSAANKQPKTDRTVDVTPGDILSEGIAEELDVVLGDVEDVHSPSTAFLVGLSGKHAGKLFRVREGESIIGRSSRALVSLEEKPVSHQHAKLHLSSKGCFVTDLGSTNGSFVNDERLEKPRELQAGDVMRFGNSTLGYLTDAEDDAQHTRALARVTQTNLQVQSPQGGQALTAGTRGITHPSLGVSQAVNTASAITVSDPSIVIPSAPESSLDQTLDNAIDKLALAMAFLRNYWKYIALCSVGLAVVAASTVAFIPPQAVASFEIFLRSDRTQNPTQHFATRSVDFFVSAEKNFSNLELVKTTMQDMKLPIDNVNVVRGTAKGLSFEQMAPSTYEGKFRGATADFAERFLATHVQNYLEREIGKSISVLQSEVDLLRKQFENNQTNLKKLETDLRDFKIKNLDALPDQARGQIASLVSLTTQRDQLLADTDRYAQELALAQKQLASEDVFETAAVSDAKPYEDALTDVRKKIAIAKAKGFAEGHPDLQKLRVEEKEITHLRDTALRRETSAQDRRANSEHKRLANEVGRLEVALSTSRKELGLVQSRISSINKVSGALPKVEADFADLSRDVASSQSLHARLYDQLKAKELQLEFERASVAARYEIMEPPSAYPVQPVKTAAFRAGVGGAGGLFGGILLCALHWLISYARSRRRDSGSRALVKADAV